MSKTFDNLITLTQISDGAPGSPGAPGRDGGGYYIETNQEEILKFVTSNGYTYSPSLLTFKVYDMPRQIGNEQYSLTMDDFKIKVLGTDGSFKNIPSQFQIEERIFDIYTLGLSESTEEEAVIDEKTVYLNVQNFNYYCEENREEIFWSNNFQFILRFVYLEEGKELAIKDVIVRYGLSNDMARLNLNAADITASIQTGQLKFDASGLSLFKDQDRIFYVGASGEAFFKGTVYATNGEFSGTLEAATGSFSGHVEATSGSIGELSLEDGVLYSEAQGGDKYNSILRLDGKNGFIYAKNITIGSGAEVEDYLSLGEARILNPLKNEGLILEAGKIGLTQNGILSIGNILINGGSEDQTSFISASNISGSSGWKINGDGTAYFNEIITNKVTIQNSIMEIGSIQSVGSLMLFKDSWKILSVNGYKCELELTLTDNNGVILAPPLAENDYVLVNGIHYKIINIEASTYILTLDKLCGFSKGDVLTKIGKENDCLITIQGDSNQTFSQSTKNSLTLSSFCLLSNESVEKVPAYTKKLVLGELSGIDGASGIGLYAENVFLNGTLTTKVQEGSYAGVNTISGAKASKFGEADQSKIVFWAGSEGIEQKNIETAKFQVTENGSIYASQGVFEGSIITRSTIKGASLYTTKIYGEDENEKAAALEIYDALNGILFMDSRKNSQPQPLLKINQFGLYKNLDCFIDLQDDINFLGKQLILKDLQGQTVFSPNKMEFEGKQRNGELFFENGFEFILGNSKLIFDETKFLVNTNANLQQNVQIGIEGQNGTLDYQKVDNYGYNLYVR